MSRPLTPLLLAVLVALAGCDAGSIAEPAAAPGARAGLTLLPYDEYVSFVVIGHSNVKGQGDARQSLALGDGEGFDYSTFDGALHPLLDPVGFNEPDPQVWNCAGSRPPKSPCFEAKTGSMWPAFARAFITATGKGVAVTGRGRGASVLTPELNPSRYAWDPRARKERITGLNFFDEAARATGDMLAAMDQLATQNGAASTFGGWVVMLGNTDAKACVELGTSCRVTAAEVVENWVDVLDEFRTDVNRRYGGMVYLIKDGDVRGGLPGSMGEEVRDGMVAACIDHAYCEVATEVAPTLASNPDYYKGDGIHFNQAGLNLIGTEAGEGVAAHF
jgi:hypothetical protein